MAVGSVLDPQNSIAFTHGQLRIDLNGDGHVSATDDFQISLPDIKAVAFDVTTDLFMLA